MFVMLFWHGIVLALVHFMMLIFFAVAIVLAAVVLAIPAFDAWQLKERDRRYPRIPWRGYFR